MASEERCEHCGCDKIYSGPPDCPRCGAPNCCEVCCIMNTKDTRIALLERRERTREAWELIFGRSDSESKMLDSIRDCLGPDGRDVE